MPDKVLKSVAVKDARIGTGNKLVCLPSVTGVMDLYGDVIFPGSFKKCLKDFLRRGFVPTDHEWHWTALVGFPTVAYEQGNALYSEFTFHSDQNSQDAKTKCVERLDAGLEVGLSIGFSMMPGQYVYFASGKELLAYAKSKGYDMGLFDVKGIGACQTQCTGIVEIEELWEYSLTPSPANQAAMAIAVKSVPGLKFSAREGSQKPSGGKRPMKLNTICGGVGLPLADEDAPWSAKSAIQRLKEHFQATDEPNEAFARCFVLASGPADEFESLRLPFCDVVNGEVKAIPKAIQSAAAVVNGDRAGDTIPDKDTDAAKTFLSGYYDAMKLSAPWGADGAMTVWKGQYLGEYTEYSMCMSAMRSAHYALESEVADAMLGYGDYSDMTSDDVDDAVSGMFDEHKALCMAVYKAIKSGSGAETPDEAKKSLTNLQVSLLSSLGDGLTYTKHGRALADAARSFLARSRDRTEMRLKEGRTLSEANRQALKDHRDTLEQCVKTIDDLLKQTEPRADAEKARALRVQFLKLQAAA